MHDVIVIGGGVVGSSAAYRLARAGANVALVDAELDGQATAAGAGIISPGTAMTSTDRVPAGFLPLAFGSGRYYSELHHQLAEDGETDTGYAVVGSLVVAADEAEARRLTLLERHIAARRAAGAPGIGEVSRLDARAARELFPPLAEQVVGVIHVGGTARVDGRLLRGALRRAAQKRGARLLRGQASLVHQGDRVAGVRVNGEVLATGSVVIATGAWTSALLGALRLKLPIQPERGQIIHFEVPGADTGHWPVIIGFHHAGYVVSFPTSRVAAGATREPGAGQEVRVTARGVQEILTQALRLAPGLADATLREVRVGIRPVTPDLLPIIGPVPGLRNAYLCAGHGHHGLLMGPYSGALIADLALDRAPDLDLAPFAAERFQRAGNA
jgi:D-amino-acid dehydrogenase